MFYLINEDISDGMIEDNAKIWCMFCNTDVSKALDDANKGFLKDSCLHLIQQVLYPDFQDSNQYTFCKRM